MRKLRVNIPDRSYDIEIEKGLLNKLDEKISTIYKGNRLVVITDENVSNIYGDKIKDILSRAYEVHTIVLRPGEVSKSMEALMGMYSKLIELGITKKDMIIAFGGGVVGDVAGYCAASYLRGIPFIQVPTTLLSQVDSSVGGKVAINLPEGKNLVGAFYQPKAVFIDPNFLDTLKDRYLKDGMGEVIKYGCIRDIDLFNRLKSKDIDNIYGDMEEIIYRCCDIKREIVELDEQDQGIRMILNFGHTIGHGVESYYGYSDYTHGEAVAIGMYAISIIGEIMGITKEGVSKEIKEVLIRFGLPYLLPELDDNKLISKIYSDKKMSGDILNLILLKNIGDCEIEQINRHDIGKLIVEGRQYCE